MLTILSMFAYLMAGTLILSILYKEVLFWTDPVMIFVAGIFIGLWLETGIVCSILVIRDLLTQ